MDSISQKNIDSIIEILRKDATKEDTSQRLQLANMLEKAEIIPAMYIMTYLQAVDKVRKDTQVKDIEDSKKYKMKSMKNDFTKFSEQIRKAYSLELHYLIDTPEKFEGAMWLLYQALNRKDKFCDFDDTKLPQKKIGRCESEDHLEIVEEPIIPLTDKQQKKFDKLCETENLSHVVDKYFLDNFNPDNQELSLSLGWDEDSLKLSDDGASYCCSACTQYYVENNDGSSPACDMESLE